MFDVFGKFRRFRNSHHFIVYFKDYDTLDSNLWNTYKHKLVIRPNVLFI